MQIPKENDKQRIQWQREITSWKAAVSPTCRFWSLGSDFGAASTSVASSSSLQSCNSRQMSDENERKLPPCCKEDAGEGSLSSAFHGASDGLAPQGLRHQCCGSPSWQTAERVASSPKAKIPSRSLPSSCMSPLFFLKKWGPCLLRKQALAQDLHTA